MLTRKQLLKFPEKKNGPKNKGSVRNDWLEELNIHEKDYDWLDEDEVLEIQIEQSFRPVSQIQTI